MVEFIPQHTKEYKTRNFVRASFSWKYTVRILVHLNHHLLVLAVLNQTFQRTYHLSSCLEVFILSGMVVNLQLLDKNT